jgi:hypothetical protein
MFEELAVKNSFWFEDEQFHIPIIFNPAEGQRQHGSSCKLSKKPQGL